MKKQILSLAAACLMALCLCACGGNGSADREHNDTSSADGSYDAGDRDDALQNSDSVKKDDCSSVYAKVVSVDGRELTVSTGGRTLRVNAESDLLQNWKADDEVILFYTGAFGDEMQVHYIDKWTENSTVARGDEAGQDGSIGSADSSAGKNRIA